MAIDSPASGRNVISGTSDGVAFTPLTFFDVNSFTVDTATNDGPSAANDAVTLNKPGLVATGLQYFSVNTGSGDDIFTVNSGIGLAVSGGSFFYDAGTQATAVGDKLVLNATGANIGAFNPDGSTTNDGTFTEDGADLITVDLERAEVDGFGTFSLTTSGTGGDTVTVDADTTNTNSPRREYGGR